MGEDFVLMMFCAGPVMGILLLGWFACAQKRRPGKAGWVSLMLGNALVLAVLLSLIPPAGEIYYRFIYETTDSLVYTKTSRHWMERHWQLNDDNLRDDILVPMARVEGKRRVTFIGDSFTAAHGVKDIRNRFVNLIRAAHPEWEVHMFAVPGFDTWEESDILSFYLKGGYQLDEVVLVYCLNDVSDLLPGRAKNLARINREIAAQSWLQRNSYLADTLHHRWQARRDPFIKNYYGFVRDGYSGEIWEKEKQRLNDFCTMVQTNKAHVSVVTFPFFHALGKDYDYQFAHDQLDKYWRETGVPHLDLLSIYRDLPKDRLIVNRLDPHPNEYAHKLAADAIDKFLREQLRR